VSKLDIINEEIARREEAVQSLIDGEQALIDTIEQFNKLDEFYREQEQESREYLECVYKENRHFTGEEPIVYSFAQTEIRPFFGGSTDAECNPYFPITKVQDGTFDGIEPLEAPPTKTGAFQRQQSYSPTENVARVPALVELQNFPDISGEPLPPGWPGPAETNTGPDACYYAVGATEPECTSNGGDWVLNGDPIPDPTWNGPDTAPALLRVALNAWRADLVLIRDDVCDDAAEVAYWQGIIDDIDIVLAAVASDAVFVRATGNSDPAAWGQTQAFTGATEAARARLETAADTGIPAHVATRQAFLDGEASGEETSFFDIIKLRLHQVNGSYAKLQAAKESQGQSAALIADHEAALESLNVMKVKNS
jgi:hypothetical protein